MFIQDIFIKNFRCYKKLDLKFKTTNDKNIALITGETASGKTSLFNAVGWCLYGDETQMLLGTKSDKISEKPVPNESSYESDGYARVSVRITIKIPELPQLHTVVVERKAKFMKNARQPTFIELNVQAFDKSGIAQHSGFDSKQILNSILVPKELASFYLFDGEFLKQTQKLDEEINTGFNKLFRLDDFKKVSEILHDIYNDYSDAAAKSSYANTMIQTKYTRLKKINDDLAELKDDIEKIEKEISDFNKEKKTAMSEAEASIRLIKLKEEYQKYTAERDLARKELEEENKRFAVNIIQSAHFLNSDDIRHSVLKSIQNVKEIKENKLPSDVRVPFFNGLLKEKCCICGTDIISGSKEEKSILRLRDEIAETNEKEFLIDLKWKLEGTSSDVKSKREEIEASAGNIKELSSKLGKINDAIEKILAKDSDIEKELHENPIEKIRWLEDQILQRVNYKQQQESKLDALIREQNMVNDEIRKLEEKTGEDANFINLISTTSTLSSIIDSFGKKAIEYFSELLEEEINILLKNNEKLNIFKVERKINESGEVEFNFKEEGSQSTYFSGGQTQLKGIIQIAAFTRVIDKVYKEAVAFPFVVMDHPISDVDKERIKKIAKEIGSLFRNSQVVLFVANDKFDVFNTISKENISNTFLVKNHEKESTIDEMK